MIFDNKWMLQRAERKLAGLSAKLKATRELWNLCEKSVPAGIVMNMENLPQEIAELEVRISQLKES